jgi:hypothetical protein
MALYDKAEFSKLCGIKSRELSVYIRRGKVVLTGDKIDDGKEVNREFLRKRRQHVEDVYHKDYSTPEVTTQPKPETKKRRKKSPDLTDAVVNSDMSDDGDGLYHLEKKEKQLKNEKLIEEIEIKKIQKAKLYGEVLPTDQVKELFSQTTKTFVVEFYNSVDKILTVISKKKGLTNDEFVQLRKDLISEINIASNKVIDDVKTQIKNIIKDVTETRGVGEHM